MSQNPSRCDRCGAEGVGTQRALVGKHGLKTWYTCAAGCPSWTKDVLTQLNNAYPARGGSVSHEVVEAARELILEYQKCYGDL